MINQDSILIFGSSGQIGKSLIRKFTKNNYRVIAVTRSIHRKGYQIKRSQIMDIWRSRKLTHLMRRISED